MIDRNMIDRWLPVINNLKTANYEHKTRPWTDDKMMFIAKSCEEIHNQIETTCPNRFDPLPMTREQKQKEFMMFINSRVKEWDERPGETDFEKVHAKIYNEILNELEYANDKWGTEFDDKNTMNDWVTYICMYATDAAKMNTCPADARSKLLKTAGLALSALATLERNGSFDKRHYEDEVKKDG